MYHAFAASATRRFPSRPAVGTITPIPTVPNYPEVDVDEAAQLLAAAQRHHRNDEDDEALGAVTQALDLRPDYPEALELRGTLYLGATQPEQAFADLTRAVQLAPKSASARSLRGMAYRQMGLFNEALTDLNEALRLDPGLRMAYVTRAHVFVRKGDRKRAIEDFTRALRIGPSPYVHNERAACHYRLGNYADAIADHAAAVKLDPKDEASCNGLAWILATCPLAHLRDGRRAVELATRACEETAFADSGYVDTLAVACAEAGDYAAAIRHGEAVLALVEEKDRGEYEERLALYRAGKPYHTPGTPA
jgi:tetratricopeptide (TPR) repeat protein